MHSADLWGLSGALERSRGAPQGALEMGIATVFSTSSTGLYLLKIENREESQAICRIRPRILDLKARERDDSLGIAPKMCLKIT